MHDGDGKGCEAISHIPTRTCASSSSLPPGLGMTQRMMLKDHIRHWKQWEPFWIMFGDFHFSAAHRAEAYGDAIPAPFWF